MNTKSKLIFWTGEFSKSIITWLELNHPLFMQEWEYSLTQEKELMKKSGYGPGMANAPLIDRKGEDEFTFYTKKCIEWVPFQEYPKTTFADCMFETSQHIANKGKTIDFFWSGGLDSNASLLAFNELGLQKQLHVIMGGKLESPDLFKKIVKDRIDYTWDETSTQEVLYGLAKPDEHIVCSGAECDGRFGSKSSFAGRGIVVKDWFDKWEAERRYYSSFNTWRYVTNFNKDWLDVDNYMPFYVHESIEKWLCNHVISGDMVYYDLTHEGWGDWYKTGEAPDAPSQEYYKKCKMPIRDFMYDITNDEYTYQPPKNASGLRLTRAKSLRVLAITGEGEIITHDNFNDFDWNNYIVDL